MKSPRYARLASLFLLLVVGAAQALAFRLPQSIIHPLPSWNDSPTRSYILDYLNRATNPADPGFVPTEERVAVFDLDGTLLCEKPQYFQILVSQQKLRDQVAEDPTLANTQPWKSAVEEDHEYVFAQNKYEEVTLTPFVGVSERDYMRYATQFLETRLHPRFNRPYIDLYYQPMVELMSLLVEKNFDVYVVAGSQTGFIRAALNGRIHVPPDRTIGTRIVLQFKLVQGQPTFIRGDKYLNPINIETGKPINIWEEIGRPPVFAAGNSTGDVEMLEYATRGKRKGLALVIHHDDSIREYAYSDEPLLRQAAENSWVVVSMKTDFKTIFAPRE